MNKFLCVYFASKRNFLCFFLSFYIRIPQIVKSEITKHPLFAQLLILCYNETRTALGIARRYGRALGPHAAA